MISPAGGALSSKPAGRRCCCRSMGQTDGLTGQHATIAPLKLRPHGAIQTCLLLLLLLFLKPTSTKPQAGKLGYTYKIMVATVIYSVTMVLLERNRISSLYSHGKARWKRIVVSWVSCYYYTIGSGVIKQALHLDEGERIVKLKDNAEIECTANGRMYCAAVAVVIMRVIVRQP